MLTLPQKDNNLIHYRFTPTGGLVVTILVMTLLALGERILYDLARTFASGPLDYFDNLNIIVVHSIFIILLLIISLVVNMTIGESKQKYALALIPYFVVSIILAFQLILEISVYFSHHHTKLQLYIVLVALCAVCTVAMYFIQKRHIISS